MPSALVTGASRGVGRGVACALAEAGVKVFATARSIGAADLPKGVIRISCDHLNDNETAAALARIHAEVEAIDILVNSAWGGYEKMVEDGKFTWSAAFWEQPMHRWTSMIDAGLRASFVTSSYAARRMITKGRGFIVNMSYWAAQKYLGNTIYGISKAATDKMTADMARELRPYGVAAVALYPGLVRTESVLSAARGGWLDLTNSESPQFIGRVVEALSRDPELMGHSGKVIVAAEAALKLGVKDLDGKQPTPMTLESS